MIQGTKFEKMWLIKKVYKSPDSSCESEDATEKAIPLLVSIVVTVTISFGEISDH